MKKGWQKTARLGDLFMTAAGGTPLTTKREYYEGGTIPWLNSGEVRQGVVHSAKTFITELGLRNSNAKIFPKDTVLVALYGATAAQVGILSIEAATNQAVFGIYPNSSFLPKFIFYFLLSCHQELSDQAVGSAQPNLSGLKVKDLQVPLAPLPEQQRIVGLLDEAFGGLATAQAHAAQNLQNARDLFESHLNAVFTQRGEGWVEERLSELCDIKHGYAFEGEFFSNQGDYVLLTPGNFYESGGYRDRGEKQKYYIGPIPQDFVLTKGDMLVAMTEQAAGLLGSPILVPETDKFLHNQRLGLVTAKRAVPWLNEFFFHVFNLAAVRQAIHDSASGTKVRHTSPTKIGAVRAWFPPVAEQKRIAVQLDDLAAETQGLTRIYEQKLMALAALKKSLLHQAFSGEL